MTAVKILPGALAALLLYMSTRSEPGGTIFYAATFATAALYFLAWALWRSPSHPTLPKPGVRVFGRGAAIGLGMLAMYLVGAVILKHIPPLVGPVHALLDNQRFGIPWLTALSTLINGVGEELYFRQVVPGRSHGTSWRTWIWPLTFYVAVTAALGVPVLALAAITMGIATHYEVTNRRGGIWSAITLHVLWSQGMLWLLPLVLA